LGEAEDVSAQSDLRSSPLVLREAGLTWRALDDEVVVLDLETSLYLKVKGAGAAVWPLLAAGTTLDAMVEAVLEVYEIDEEAARRDLSEFLDDLNRRELLG
jgi:hypothetical protein